MSEHKDKFRIADVKVEPDINQLSRHDEFVLIEGRLMALLVFLCRHAGKTVSREALIQNVWQGNVVGSSAIYRAMAELRKVLEKQFGISNLIKTIPKKGYLVEPDSISGLEVGQSKSSGSKFRRVKLFGVALLIVVVSYFTLFAIIETSYQPTNSVRVKTLTSLSGAEFSPALSPKGDWLLFSHRQMRKGSSQLYLLRVEHSKQQSFTKDSSNVEQKSALPLGSISLTKQDVSSSFSRASWSTRGEQIAYQRVSNNSCEILVANINLNSYQIEHPRKVADCTDSVTSPISWSNNDKSLFFISALSGRMESVMVDLDSDLNSDIGSKRPQVIMSPKNPLGWNNFIVSSPFDSKVLILSFIDYRKTQFILYDFNEGTHQIIHTEPHFIRSASWGMHSQQIIFEMNAQRLVALDLESSQTNIWYEPGIYLNGITRSKQQPVFAVGQKQQAEEAIKVAKLEKLQDVSDEWGVNSSLIDKLPEFANLSNQLAFISNRSGNDQIWLRRDNGTLERLTNFPDERWFGRLRWSNDDSRILFARGEIIYWLELETGELKTLVKYPDNESKVPYAPNWSADNSSIFYSVHQQGKNSIWQMEFNGEPNNNKLISSGNNRNLQQSPDGLQLYFTTIGIYGLTRFDISSGEYHQVLPELHPNSWNSWRLTQQGIYYLDINQEPPAVYFYDFDSNRRHQIFEWDLVTGAHFSISFDKSFYARDSFINSEASIVKIVGE